MRDSSKPYVVFASWDLSQLYRSPPTTLSDAASHLKSNERPINVHYYITATVSTSCDDNCQRWTLARVSWFYPNPHRYAIGKPAELWCTNMFEAFGMHSYIPLDHLLCRCAHVTQTINGDSVLTVIPLV